MEENVTQSTTHQSDPIQNTYVQSWFYITYTIIFVLGLIGNILVCFVVVRNRTMQTVTNIFITNLALSDILLCILAVPFTPLYTFQAEWLFGNAICHLVPVSQAISVYISTLTLTSIAIDRYIVIIYPFRQRMQIKTTIIIIIAIWMFSILVTLPYGIYMELTEHRLSNQERVFYCEERWPSDIYRQLFGTCTTLMQFVIPFILIAYCYTRVSVKLNDRARSKPGSTTSRRDLADRDRTKRTNRMLIAMVAIFLLSWLPLNLINIISDFNGFINDWPLYLITFIMCHCMAMSSTCYNPFLYAWLNENFRKEFVNILPCFQSTDNRLRRFSTTNYTYTCNDTTFTRRKSFFVNENQRIVVSYDKIDDLVQLNLIVEDEDRLLSLPPDYQQQELL